MATESEIPFDSAEFCRNALTASAAGKLLVWLHDQGCTRVHQHFDQVLRELTTLHNAQELNALQPVLTSELESLTGRDFFLIQDLYCQLIPNLEADIDELMEAVLKLVDVGGQDLAANQPNSAFRDWLSNHPDQTNQLLERVETGTNSDFPLLTFVLEAGARFSFERYHSAALRLLSSIRPEFRLAAVIALSRIPTLPDMSKHQETVSSLANQVLATEDNNERTSSMASLLDVHAQDVTNETELVIEAIKFAISQPTDGLHFILAQRLAQHYKVLSLEAQQLMIDALRHSHPAMKGVVDQLDFAFSQCITDDNRQNIADCLRQLLNHPEHPLDIGDLDSFCHRLGAEKPQLLSWLVIYWLRFGDHRSRQALPVLFRRYHETGLTLDWPLREFALSDEELVFICKKTIGYFLIEARTAASILIACIDAAQTDETAQSIASLLFDPLMLNYSGQAREYIEPETKKRRPRQKFLKSAVKQHDDYLAGLRSVGKIPELWPSAAERQIQAERQRALFSQSFAEAHSESSLLNFVSRQTLLHGEGSVSYYRDFDGNQHRSETMLSSHGTSMEVPRYEAVDPLYFQHLIFLLRNETFPE